jgi:hypothetical protein
MHRWYQQRTRPSIPGAASAPFHYSSEWFDTWERGIQWQTCLILYLCEVRTSRNRWEQGWKLRVCQRSGLERRIIDWPVPFRHFADCQRFAERLFP